MDPALIAKMKAILTGIGNGAAPNPYRMQNVLDKIRVQRELADGPRRIEHTGGYFKYPPIESMGEPPSPVEAATPTPAQKTAAALRAPHVVLRGI